jgi:hypothetical protein
MQMKKNMAMHSLIDILTIIMIHERERRERTVEPWKKIDHVTGKMNNVSNVGPKQTTVERDK